MKKKRNIDIKINSLLSMPSWNCIFQKILNRAKIRHQTEIEQTTQELLYQLFIQSAG